MSLAPYPNFRHHLIIRDLFALDNVMQETNYKGKYGNLRLSLPSLWKSQVFPTCKNTKRKHLSNSLSHFRQRGKRYSAYNQAGTLKSRTSASVCSLSDAARSTLSLSV